MHLKGHMQTVRYYIRNWMAAYLLHLSALSSPGDYGCCWSCHLVFLCWTWQLKAGCLCLKLGYIPVLRLLWTWDSLALLPWASGCLLFEIWGLFPHVVASEFLCILSSFSSSQGFCFDFYNHILSYYCQPSFIILYEKCVLNSNDDIFFCNSILSWRLCVFFPCYLYSSSLRIGCYMQSCLVLLLMKEKIKMVSTIFHLVYLQRLKNDYPSYAGIWIRQVHMLSVGLWLCSLLHR